MIKPSLNQVRPERGRVLMQPAQRAVNGGDGNSEAFDRFRHLAAFSEAKNTGFVTTAVGARKKPVQRRFGATNRQICDDVQNPLHRASATIRKKTSSVLRTSLSTLKFSMMRLRDLRPSRGLSC